MLSDEDRAALRSVLAGRCSTCLRPLATDEHWETTSGGERPDLCWEISADACPWESSESRDALYEAAVEAIVRRHVTAALNDAAEDPSLRLSGHGGISVRRLRARART